MDRHPAMEHFKTDNTAPERPPIAPAGVEKPRSISRETAHAPEKLARQRAAPKSKVRQQTPGRSATRQVRVVEFRSGEAVARHPALRDLLAEGWRIKSAVPHLEESEEVKLLVVLNRGPES